MDRLTRYLISPRNDSNKLQRILDKKIIITSNHIALIHKNKLHSITLFVKYGYVFTDDEYIELINKTALALYYIPIDRRIYKICEIAIKQNADLLSIVPKDIITYKLCKIAVKKNGWVLRYVPKHLKTDTLCKIAFQNNNLARYYVPDDKKHLCIYE